MLRRLLILVLAMPAAVAVAQRPDGQLRLDAVDRRTGQPVAVRMLLKNARGRTVGNWRSGVLRAGGSYFFIDGMRTLPLLAGQYTFEVEASPEYRTISGHFEIERHADDSKRIEMQRFADLAEEGWWAGDLDVPQPPKDLPLVMRAEGLHIVPVPEDAVPPGSAAQTDPARDSDVRRFAGGRSPRRLARTPFAWNLPLWLAKDELTAVTLIHHHARRNGVVDNEGDGRPRDRALFPGPAGNGRWSEAVYYHALNCGLRIPPAAGSGDVGRGADATPVGTNRVYVYCGDEFSDERWWEGLEAGRVFVTNGPLLRPLVEGERPGHVFHLAGGETISLEIGLNLATRTPVEYLEIIKNGQVEVSERLSDWVNKKGRLPPLTFDASGWFLVRAVTSDRSKYQLASTGPYYVEQAGRPRISRRSVQFFLDWIAEASDRVGKLPGLDGETRDAKLAEQAAARRFFEDLLTKANAE